MPDFETLTFERDIACSPERLFHAMTDRELRQKWSGPDDESIIIIDVFDCRPGGREEARCGPKDAPDFNTTSLFHIVTPDLMSFTETLTVGGEMISISLCSNEILASGTGSKLRATLQITSLAGPEVFKDYANGWSGAIDKLSLISAASEQS